LNLKIDVGLLGSNAVWTCGYIPTVQRNILPPSVIFLDFVHRLNYKYK
jgi:hypothetical protein